MLSRRKLLSTAAFGAAAIPLAGCSELSNILNQTQAQITADAQTVAAGVAAVVNAAQGLVPANVLATAQSIAASIKADAADIGTFVSGISTNSILTDISNGVGALSGLLSPFFPEASVIGGIIKAAVALVGVILSTAGITTPSSASLKAGAPAMTPDQARAILKAAAANGIH